MAAKPDDPLFVLELEIVNFLRIGAIQITHKGAGVIEITGNNRQGKSSILKAIWAAVGGAARVPAEPIHDGEDKGYVRVKVGRDPKHPAYQVTKKFEIKDGEEVITTLKVANAEGFAAQRPQETMNGWLQSITMDPMAFLAKEPKKQAEILRKIVGLDTVQVDQRRAAAFAQRTNINRDLGRAAAQLAGLPAEEKAPKQVNVARTLEELDTARRLQQDARDRDEAIHDAGVEVERKVTAVARAEEALALAKQELLNAVQFLEKLNVLERIVVPDVEALQKIVAEADGVNRRYDRITAANKARRAKAKEVDELQAEADALTKTIETCDAERAELVAAAPMPLKGLSIDAEGVVRFSSKTKKDAPLNDCSGAERIQIALAIAMSQNPTLKVIHIDDGNKLDPAAWDELERYARKHKLQIWVETVHQMHEGAIVIVDGHVQEGNP